jgi:hypothetical protein
MVENSLPPVRREITITRKDLQAMAVLVRTVEQLADFPAYRKALHDALPAVARFDPRHDAVMMGYDFHIGPDGPKLIEVNTNAGGGLLALQAGSPEFKTADIALDGRLGARLREMFSAEMLGFSAGRIDRPQSVVILDEEPQAQFLYPEMQAFCDFFREWGCKAAIVDPSELQAGPEGVMHQGEPVDMIYNRHCDFYLESPELEGLRQAYLNSTVCLTPNPFRYGLLADKRRLCFWSEPDQLAEVGLDPSRIDLLQKIVPESRMLGSFDSDELWRERKQWVFKPATMHASRGVLVGAKATRGRFQQLPDDTIVQRYIAPSMSTLGEKQFKTDFRLFAYKNRLLGIAARLYRGQVTNLRTEGGGFASVRVAD